MPQHTGAGADGHMVFLLGQHLDALDRVQQHNTGPVLREEHVAATAQHKAGQALQLGRPQHLQQLAHRAEACQACRPRGHVEGVQGLEVEIAVDLHGRAGTFRRASLPDPRPLLSPDARQFQRIAVRWAVGRFPFHGLDPILVTGPPGRHERPICTGPRSSPAWHLARVPAMARGPGAQDWHQVSPGPRSRFSRVRCACSASGGSQCCPRAGSRQPKSPTLGGPCVQMA